MTALYIMIPIALVIATSALIFFMISMKSGQFEDIEAPKYRMLFDDEFPTKKSEKK
ncbi:MAG: cbb3-type cytochrome oxidase assembly protein CcoS [Leptospiraceae bacterium]|nr:cbb3-type cytochrome oxidase assembly protein CcoS [Leptospiraceae bacterium]